MNQPIFLLQMVEATRTRTVIEVYKQGVGRMEFRSNAIWQWGMGFENQDGSTDHILNHGKNLSWAEWLHNGLEGWHTCIFYTGDQFPARYRNQIFIAEHGSWNRSRKSGYRITLVRLDGNRVVSYEPFAQGWLQDQDNWGRPAALLVLPDGSLLVSDDQAGAVYRIVYEG